MLHPVTFRTLALAACGWLLACDADALTLGRARGAVLIGRPLDLAIPVSLEGGDGDAPCADADVFYGDQKVGRAPGVRYEPAAGRQGVLRVSSPLVVDEPMVTVYLRVGCGQSVTRRYVLLSELPPEREPAGGPVLALPARPAAAPAPSQAVTTAAEAAPAARAPAALPPPVVRRRAAAAPAAAETVAAAPAAPVQARPSPRPARAQATPPKGHARPQSRLQVDLLDLAPERDPTLRLSSELNLPAVTDPQARQHAAALWQALQRSPEQSVQDGLKLQALERDLQSLRLQTQQNAAAVTEMRAQVEKARSERNGAAWLALALLAALAAVIGWMAWQRHRARQLENVRRWFEETPRDTVLPVAVAAPPPVTEPTIEAEDEEEHIDIPMDDTPRRPLAPSAAEAIAKASPSGWGSLAAPEFQASLGGTLRMVGVQELIDVHDKADFFLALGQHDQAIAVLESHVHDQVETSALAWMDLLELYHSLGKRAEYDRLRDEFRQRFAVQVPEFDRFDQPTSSLENYGRALSRIVALWPSQRVLAVIEESIFRKPGLPGAEPFSLEAYRELVLLYHIAKDVAPADDSLGMPLDYRPTDFPATSLQPLNALDTRSPLLAPVTRAPDLAIDSRWAGETDEATVVMGRTEHVADRDRLMIPPSSPRIGLDIDLDEPEQEAVVAGRELPPLDFDTSEFDDWNTQNPQEPPRRH